MGTTLPYLGHVEEERPKWRFEARKEKTVGHSTFTNQRGFFAH
jgi:hypothetical protein